MLSLKKLLSLDLIYSKKLLYFLSFGSGIYITLNTFFFLRHYWKEKKETKHIMNFLNKEKEKYSNVDNSKLSAKDKCDQIYYFLYIVMKQFYSKQLLEFDLERRIYFDISSNNNLKKYIKCIKKFHKIFKEKEENIIKLIKKTFNFNDIEIDNLYDEIDQEYFIY